MGEGTIPRLSSPLGWFGTGCPVSQASLDLSLLPQLYQYWVTEVSRHNWSLQIDFLTNVSCQLSFLLHTANTL